MKQCPNCGNQPQDGEKSCGVSQTPDASRPCGDPAPKPEALRKKKTGLIIGLIAVVLVVLAVLVVQQRPGTPENGEFGVLFLRDEQLWYVDESGERLMREEPWNPGPPVAVSLDGRWLTYTEDPDSDVRSALICRDTLSGESRTVSQDVYSTSVTINPDGSEIYYIRGGEHTLCVDTDGKIAEISTGVTHYYPADSRIYYIVQTPEGRAQLFCWDQGESRLLETSGILTVLQAYSNGEIYFQCDERVDARELLVDDGAPAEIRECLNRYVDVSSYWWSDGETVECLAEQALNPIGEADCSAYEQEPVLLVPRLPELSGFASGEELEKALEEIHDGVCAYDLSLARGRELTHAADGVEWASMSDDCSHVIWLANPDENGRGQICVWPMQGEPDILAENVWPNTLGIQGSDQAYWTADGILYRNGESLGEAEPFGWCTAGVEGFLYMQNGDELCVWQDGSSRTLTGGLEAYNTAVRSSRLLYRNSQGEIYSYDRGEPRLLAKNADRLLQSIWEGYSSLPTGYALDR